MITINYVGGMYPWRGMYVSKTKSKAASGRTADQVLKMLLS